MARPQRYGFASSPTVNPQEPVTTSPRDEGSQDSEGPQDSAADHSLPSENSSTTSPSRFQPLPIAAVTRVVDEKASGVDEKASGVDEKASGVDEKAGEKGSSPMPTARQSAVSPTPTDQVDISAHLIPNEEVTTIRCPNAQTVVVRVNRDEFLRLLISHRDLARIDRPEGRCGLFDAATNQTFEIDEQELLPPIVFASQIDLQQSKQHFEQSQG